jgi:hypothetical protein
MPFLILISILGSSLRCSLLRFQLERQPELAKPSSPKQPRHYSRSSLLAPEHLQHLVSIVDQRPPFCDPRLPAADH